MQQVFCKVAVIDFLFDVVSILVQMQIKSCFTFTDVLQPAYVTLNDVNYPRPEMYPGFQIMGSSGPLLEKFGGSLQSIGGPALTRLINIRQGPDPLQVEKHANCSLTTDSF